jgi:hypothetical protein
MSAHWMSIWNVYFIRVGILNQAVIWIFTFMFILYDAIHHFPHMVSLSIYM